MTTKYMIRIDGVPAESQYNALSWGRQTEHKAAIDAFKARAKRMHYSAKGITTASAFRRFRKEYQPTQWFAVNRDAHLYHDDSFEVWYV